MPEIVVVAVITGKPGTGDQVLDALSTLTAATHGEEGCLFYSLNRDAENPDRFTTVERWTSLEALQQHLDSPHLKAALGAAGDLLAEPPLIVPATQTGAGDAGKNTF